MKLLINQTNGVFIFYDKGSRQNVQLSPLGQVAISEEALEPLQYLIDRGDLKVMDQIAEVNGPLETNVVVATLKASGYKMSEEESSEEDKPKRGRKAKSEE
jgi:hypothetical protein